MAKHGRPALAGHHALPLVAPRRPGASAAETCPLF
jgi:hypothetical protein